MAVQTANPLWHSNRVRTMRWQAGRTTWQSSLHRAEERLLCSTLMDREYHRIRKAPLQHGHSVQNSACKYIKLAAPCTLYGVRIVMFYRALRSCARRLPTQAEKQSPTHIHASPLTVLLRTYVRATGTRTISCPSLRGERVPLHALLTALAPPMRGQASEARRFSPLLATGLAATTDSTVWEYTVQRPGRSC